MLRAARRVTFVLAACAGVGACTDEPVSPSTRAFQTSTTSSPAASPANQTAATASPATSPVPSCEPTIGYGRSELSISWEGSARPIRVLVPRQAETGPIPAMLAFHGEGNSLDEFISYTQLDLTAEGEGFILAVPGGSGYPPGWDVPGVYRDEGLDDLGFAEALRTLLIEQACADPDRVYAVGFSNGAELASALACRSPDLFRGAAAVAGLVFGDCLPGQTAIIGIHGTWDGNVGYESARTAADEWAVHLDCGDAVVEALPPDIEIRRSSDCSGWVTFITVFGGGHTWPGAQSHGGAGPVTSTFAAGEALWALLTGRPWP